MNEFLYLSNLDCRNINLQIIKSFSLLILNVSNPQTIYYIFSNNFINQILVNDYEKYDEEFVSHYVNFLKSLSSKLDPTIIQFFFHKQYNSFPLCSATLKLYNYPDSMIKNTVRNIILFFLKLKYEPILDYFCSLPSVSYFPFLALSFRDLIIKLNEEIMTDDNNYQGLHSVQDDIIIDILYFQDIFSLKILKISNLLLNSLFYYTILPLLCGSLVSVNRPKIGISTALYVLIILFEYVKDESFLNALYSVLFLNKISRKIIRLIKEYPNNIKNYYSCWNEQKKASFPSYFDYVSLNFSEPFISLLVSNSTNYLGETMMSDYKEINDIKKTIKKKLKDGFDLNNTQHYQIVLQEVLKHMSKSELDIMINYHKNLSVATGHNVGLFSDDYKKNSFSMMMHKMFYKIKAEQDYLANLNDLANDTDGGQLITLNLMNNEVKQNIFSYLRSKDDTLIILVSTLIFTCQQKNISNELQIVCGLAKAESHKNSNYNTKEVLNQIFDNNEYNKVSDEFEMLELETNEVTNKTDKVEKTIKQDLKINEFLDIDLTQIISKVNNIESDNNKPLNEDKKESKITNKKANLMDFYDKVNKENLYFDNNFIFNELKCAEQACYDKNLIDSLIEVRHLILIYKKFLAS
jgi:hypothetical protein